MLSESLGPRTLWRIHQTQKRRRVAALVSQSGKMGLWNSIVLVGQICMYVFVYVQRWNESTAQYWEQGTSRLHTEVFTCQCLSMELQKDEQVQKWFKMEFSSKKVLPKSNTWTSVFFFFLFSHFFNPHRLNHLTSRGLGDRSAQLGGAEWPGGGQDQLLVLETATLLGDFWVEKPAVSCCFHKRKCCAGAFFVEADWTWTNDKSPQLSG